MRGRGMGARAAQKLETDCCTTTAIIVTINQKGAFNYSGLQSIGQLLMDRKRDKFYYH